MTADSNVHDLGAFLREVLCLGQMRVLYMLRTVLQHCAPFPFPSYHSLTIPYPTTRDPRTAECPKIPPSQRSELPAPTLLPCKHMHRNRVPHTCQICSACPAQPWAWASLKFSRWKFTKSTCAPAAPDCTAGAFSLLLMKVSPFSAAMVESSYSRRGPGPRCAPASKGAEDTPQTLAVLQRFSHSGLLSAEQSGLAWSAS